MRSRSGEALRGRPKPHPPAVHPLLQRSLGGCRGRPGQAGGIVGSACARRYLDKLIEVDDRPAEEQTNLKREFLHFLQVRSARQEYRNAWVRACVRGCVGGWYPVSAA